MEKMALLLALIAFIAIASLLSRRTVKERAMPGKAVLPQWSEIDIGGLRQGFRDDLSVSDIAGYLLRTEDDIRQKAQELGIKLSAA